MVRRESLLIRHAYINGFGNLSSDPPQLSSHPDTTVAMITIVHIFIFPFVASIKAHYIGSMTAVSSCFSGLMSRWYRSLASFSRSAPYKYTFENLSARLTSSVVELSFVRVDEPKHSVSHYAHRQEEIKGRIVVPACSGDDGAGDKRTDEARGFLRFESGPLATRFRW